jgi:hypothetical protein
MVGGRSVPGTMEGAERPDRRDLILAAWLFLLCTAVYLLTYDGSFTSTDERALFSGTDSLVKRGEFRVDQIYWDGNNVGMYTADGEMVPNYEPAQMVLAVPLYVLGWVTGVGLVQSVMLFNPLVTALTVALFFLCLRELSYGRAVSLALALSYAFATIAWVYSKFFFREPLMGLGYVVALLGLLRYGRRRDVMGACLVGVGAGLAVATKQVGLVALPFFAALFLFYNRKAERNGFLRSVLAAGLPLLAILALLKVYQDVSLGSIPAFARNVVEYASSPLIARDNWPDMLFAAYGLTFSPGKGLFAYSPVLFLALVAAPWFLRRHPMEALIFGALAAAHVVGYSRYISWWGGLSWGPRYLLPIVPFVLIAAAPAAEKLLSTRIAVWRLLAALVVIISVVVQVAGVSVDVRMYEDVLGRTLRQQVPWFEVSMRIIAGDLRYSPILGNLALLSPANLDFAWVRTSEEGPNLLLWPLGLTLGLVVLAGAGMARTLRAPSPGSVGLQNGHWKAGRGRATILIALAFLVIPLLLLKAYYGDPRFDQGRADRFLFPLIGYLEAHVTKGDVLLMNAPTQTDFFLNYFRARTKWYGLNEETFPIKAQTADLLQKQERGASRIWLMRDMHAWADVTRGVEQSLQERDYKTEDRLFLDWMRLMAFSTPVDQPSLDVACGVELGPVRLESFRLEKRDDDQPFSIPGSSTLQVRAGSLLHVSLRWTTAQSIVRNYTVFLQLLDETSKVRLQADQFPVYGLRPTLSWAPGQGITDNYAFAMALPPGRYSLIAGMYDPATQVRLRGSDGDFVVLAEMSVR